MASAGLNRLAQSTGTRNVLLTGIRLSVRLPASSIELDEGYMKYVVLHYALRRGLSLRYLVQ